MHPKVFITIQTDNNEYNVQFRIVTPNDDVTKGFKCKDLAEVMHEIETRMQNL